METPETQLSGVSGFASGVSNRAKKKTQTNAGPININTPIYEPTFYIQTSWPKEPWKNILQKKIPELAVEICQCLEIMRKITVASCLVLTHLQKMSQKCHLPKVLSRGENNQWFKTPNSMCIYIYILEAISGGCKFGTQGHLSMAFSAHVDHFWVIHPFNRGTCVGVGSRFEWK